MASDKDHVGLAKEILSGEHMGSVVLTEAAIAGGVTRMTWAVSLKDSWIQAAEEVGVEIVEEGVAAYRKLMGDETAPYVRDVHDHRTVLATEGCLRTTDRILRRKEGVERGIIVITGSLHIVASVLARLGGESY